LNAASLKRQVIGAARFHRFEFPRSIERGLIEASPVVARRFPSGEFPRSIERGLIEAKNGYRPHYYTLWFPRSIERGLIEAWWCRSIRQLDHRVSAFN